MSSRYGAVWLLVLVLAALSWGIAQAASAPVPCAGPNPLALVVPVSGGVAGDAGDGRDTTFCFARTNEARPLVRRNGSPIGREEVGALYGFQDGMRVYDGGVDVTSSAYRGLAGPKVPVGMDLSDAAGWPNIAVPSGRIAIDPLLGRFKFHDGGAPYRVGIWDPDGAQGHSGVAVQGSYAYVTDWVRGLDIIDISDPARPVFKGNWSPTPTGWAYGLDVVVDGDYAYATMKFKGLFIVDVRDPTNPRAVGSIKASPTEADAALHLFKAGNLVYVASEKFGVVIYDVSIPSRPTRVGVCPISFAESVWVEGNLAYVTGGNVGLHIYDVSNPSRPVLRGTLPRLGYSYDVQVWGNYAYVTEGLAGLRVVDVSNPAQPVHVTVVRTPGEAYDIRIANRCAYVGERGDTGYLEVFDLRVPTAPTLLSRYATARVNGVFPRGPLVYLANQSLGLVVVNPNLPEAPAGPVTVDYNWDDRSETPTPTLVPTPTATPDPSSTMTLTLQVALQGRGAAPSPRWVVPLTVVLGAPDNGSARYTYDLICDAQGRLTITDIPQGVYDVRVRRATSLENVCRRRSLGPGTHVLDMGVLREGDSNQDGTINILDFALLASSYGTASGQPGYDARSDLNGDGRIDILDFSLLASNYGMRGPLEVSGSGS